MDKTGIHPGGEHAHDSHVDSPRACTITSELGFWRKYVFSLDHKVIGIQYAITGLLFLLFGFSLMMLMRWQLAYPGRPLPLIGMWLGQDRAPGGIMLPEFYNQLGAMHGTIMVFLGVVPLAVGGFGNFVMPLQIGAPDMAFPKLNMASYWVYFLGGVTMLASFFVPGRRRAVRAGRRIRRSPIIARTGQTMWLIGMVFLITSSLLGSVNFIVDDRPAARQGPDLHAAAVLRLGAVRHVVPAAARVPAARSGRRPAADGSPRRHQLLPAERPRRQRQGRCTIAGGGNPLLWQHLFWFLAHPEVYVLILPAMGIVAEVIANNTRKPLWGYRRWSTRSSSSASCRSSSGRTTCS